VELSGVLSQVRLNSCASTNGRPVITIFVLCSNRLPVHADRDLHEYDYSTVKYACKYENGQWQKPCPRLATYECLLFLKMLVIVSWRRKHLEASRHVDHDQNGYTRALFVIFDME
jgi:hypothetical protein